MAKSTGRPRPALAGIHVPAQAGGLGIEHDWPLLSGWRQSNTGRRTRRRGALPSPRRAGRGWENKPDPEDRGSTSVRVGPGRRGKEDPEVSGVNPSVPGKRRPWRRRCAGPLCAHGAPLPGPWHPIRCTTRPRSVIPGAGKPQHQECCTASRLISPQSLEQGPSQYPLGSTPGKNPAQSP